jgi:hypothetical protein
MEAHRGEPLDHRRDARQGPQLGGEPERLRFAAQRLGDRVQLGLGQSRPASRPARAA